MAKNLSKYVKRLAKGTVDAADTVGQGAKHVSKEAIKGTGKVLKGYDNAVITPVINSMADGTAAALKTGGRAMVKKTEPGLMNAYTGYRESGWAMGAAAVIGTAYGMGSYGVQSTFIPKQGEVSYGGTAPIHNADGVSSTTQAPTLNANGSMVFGLHNARKGQ